MQPSAMTPISICAISSTSRTQPYTTTPAQPLSIADCAIISPSNAQRIEPPPSTTKTLPLPSLSLPSLFNKDFTRLLSSKHFTVTISPQNLSLPPKLQNDLPSILGKHTCDSGLASNKSQVTKLSLFIVVVSAVSEIVKLLVKLNS